MAPASACLRWGLFTRSRGSLFTRCRGDYAHAVIVVVGQPAYRPPTDSAPGAAAGPAVGMARAAVAAGALAQLIGKVGDDQAGDALLLDLARAGIGHAAVLRDPGRPTAVAPTPAAADLGEEPAGSPRLDEAPELADESDIPAKLVDDETRLGLEAGDVDLGLRYLTGYGVIVAAEPLSEATLAIVAEAAAYAGAHLVVVTRSGAPGPVIDRNVASTLLAAPADDPDEQFARLVGRYAAALDAGAAAQEAFRTALGASAWEPVTPSA
jgi:hypothetical protein